MVGVANAFLKPSRKLLAAEVDLLAKSDPGRRFGLIPRSGQIEDGFREITFRDLARAVNAMSWWMEKNIGKPTQGETISYLGNNDVRYIVFMLASHKLGYTIFLPSTRLSNEAYANVLGVTNSTKMLFSHEKLQRVLEINECVTIDPVEVPGVTEIFDDICGLDHYPFEKTFEEIEDQVAFMIHSSGTTGMPKPVHLTHGFLGTWDNAPQVPRPEGREPSFFNHLGSADLVLSSTPYFHLMGLISFFESIFHNIPFVASPDRPLSVELLITILRVAKPTATILPPSILEDMSQSEEALDCLSTLEFVCFGGAPLSPEIGNKLLQYTGLRTVIGSSEMGIINSFVPQGEGNWGYFEWNPAYKIDMQPIGDGSYELVIPRTEHSRLMHGIFHTFPTLKEYRSKDLFTKHESNDLLWRYHGRLDDVIVLSNGEKLNPVTLEKMIENDPSVHRALLIGQGRFQSALLIEPEYACDQVYDEKQLIDSIWPQVEKANEMVPNYGRVMKNMIRLSSRGKPFKVTPKGTTQRHAVNKDYAQEIDELYAAQDDQLETQLPDDVDLESMKCYLRTVISLLLGESNFGNGDDLYSVGMDSLRTIQLNKLLKNAVRVNNPGLNIDSINLQNIYAHSTVDRLAQMMMIVIKGDASIVTKVSRSDKIANLISKYTSDLPVRSAKQSPQPPKESRVILTGSTGSLGTYLLHSLLNNKNVTKIYCFNRTDDAAARQLESFQSKGLPTSPLSGPRVEFLHVSFGESQFGLPDNKYHCLLEEVDLIIHNAWKVNFNHPVESFEHPHLFGMREFVNLSINGRQNAHLAFISSVSTIGGWMPDTMGPVVPEVAMESVVQVLEQGYGESKFVGESICVEASRKAGVPTSIFRVGQIAGPDTRQGLWNPHEWIPTLVATSKAMGKAPAELGGYAIDWVSVDALANITLDILQTRRSALSEETNAVFHLTNPHRSKWSSLIPAIQDKYPVQVVSLEDWINELEGITDPSEQEVNEKPALKLLSFYRGLTGDNNMLTAEIGVARAKQASKTMAMLGPVSRAQMSNWLDQWNF
ncbi:NRPS-like enzyme [Penicillium verhagenii]|nr:NRPS-like enzyme [Penicillium verhagenii]